MSNGAATDSLNNNSICISTLGETVMIWEKFYVEIQGGQVTPVAPEGAHESRPIRGCLHQKAVGLNETKDSAVLCSICSVL